MDTILEKFYNGGNNSNPNNFLNSGFKTSPIMTTGLSPSSKSPLPVRPMISTINSTNINLTHKPNLTINTNYNNYTETKDFLKPQKLSFNSYSVIVIYPIIILKKFIEDTTVNIIYIIIPTLILKETIQKCK